MFVIFDTTIAKFRTTCITRN